MDVDRDHIVVRPWWYSVMVFLEMAITAGILCLIFPYTGPENRLPGLHRFCIFVVCLVSNKPKSKTQIESETADADIAILGHHDLRHQFLLSVRESLLCANLQLLGVAHIAVLGRACLDHGVG